MVVLVLLAVVVRGPSGLQVVALGRRCVQAVVLVVTWTSMVGLVVRQESLRRRGLLPCRLLVVWEPAVDPQLAPLLNVVLLLLVCSVMSRLLVVVLAVVRVASAVQVL